MEFEEVQNLQNKYKMLLQWEKKCIMPQSLPFKTVVNEINCRSLQSVYS